MSRHYDTPLTALAVALLDREAFEDGALRVIAHDRDELDALRSLSPRGVLPCGLPVEVMLAGAVTR